MNIIKKYIQKIIMQIKRKYTNLLYFIKLFDKFKDGEDLVEINNSDAEIIYNTIDEMHQENEFGLEKLALKYDYDGDGKLSIIDTSIPMLVYLGVINSNDPKYDAENKTYNGKSLDVNNDNDVVSVADSIKLNTLLLNEIKQYIDCSSPINDYGNSNECTNYIKRYYRNNNYTWPTLEQLETASNNNWQ